MSNKSSGISSWIPYNLKADNEGFTCKWLYTNRYEYTEPFFIESTANCLSHSLNSGYYRSFSNINVLPQWAADLDTVPPTAFIFHVSRCGSTLISQLLGLNNQHIVLAETPFIDELLRLTQSKEWPAELHRDELVKATISIYAENRNGIKNKLFIKADSWHIHFMPMLRRLYPDVPFILLYRKPDEVIRSHQKQRGMQAVPGVVPNEVLGIEADTNNTDLNGHIAKVLEAYLSAFIRESQHDPLTLLVNYNEGIINIMQSLCSFASITLNDTDREEMSKRCQYNAKQPAQIFTETQPDEAMPAYQQQAFNLYNQLEELRLAQALPK